MIKFLWIIILSSLGHQTRILNAGLEMAWNRMDCPELLYCTEYTVVLKMS